MKSVPLRKGYIALKPKKKNGFTYWKPILGSFAPTAMKAFALADEVCALNRVKPKVLRTVRASLVVEYHE